MYIIRISISEAVFSCIFFMPQSAALYKRFSTVHNVSTVTQSFKATNKRVEANWILFIGK